MEEDPSNKAIGVDQELLSVLLQNPYLSRPEDEIGETALVKWVDREHKSRTGTKIKKQEIYGLITKLILERIFIGKRYGQKMLLKPTHNYYLLKDGQPMIQKKIDKTQTVLFGKEVDCSFVGESGSSRNNETKSTSADLNEIPIPSQLPLNNNVPYNCFLLERIRHYDGPDKDLVKYFPALFNLACNILNDKYTDWHTKILISSALGYVILENDVISDNTEFGYLDDLYILCYVLREIKQHVSPSLLDDNWEYSEDVHDLIEETYQDVYIVVQDHACEILHKVGLRKFKELELEEYSGTYPEKIAKLAQEKRELMALTAYLIKIIYSTKIDGRNLKKIKDFLLKYGDYAEITRLIELSNRDYVIEETVDTTVEAFKADLEKQLQQARLKALLDDLDTE